MIKKILILLLVTSQINALEPFKAEYTVFKDGKKIGLSSIELDYEAPFYSITDYTNGTHGMASFLGFKRTETSLFTEKEGGFFPESYSMYQKVAFNKRKSDYQVDYDSQTIIGKHKGEDWQLDIPKGFSTPNLVTLRLFNDVCSGKTENLDYTIIKEGKVKQYQFTMTSSQDNIIEIDRIHSKPERITKTWLDTNQRCLPVRTYHIEEGEDAIETKLVKVSQSSQL
ncbi:MAG: hypothetical protein AB8B80_08225 [Marinicellaceae bacterium]